MLKVTLLVFGILFYGFYVGYETQRTDYINHLQFRLELACSKMIKDDFKQHASLFSTTPTSKNDPIGVSKFMTIKNDVITFRIEGRSLLYFSDFAPQEITCNASIFSPHKDISKNTKVTFTFIVPNYLPIDYKSRLIENPKFELTIGELEKLFPLSGLIPIKKPQFFYFGILPIFNSQS